MGILKLGKGNFWGVIIPGGFLFINIFAVFYSDNLDKLILQSGLGYSFILLSILFSIIIGYVLRLIKPSYAEYFSIPILIIFLLFRKLIINLCKLSKIHPKYIKAPPSIHEITEKFPYTNLFYYKHLNSFPNSVKDFYNELLQKEFDDEIERIGNPFFSHCKNYIVENSNHLGEELFLTEGLVRFLNGMFYSLTLSIIIIFIKSLHLNFNNEIFNYILLGYIFSLLVILIRYKSVRKLEAVMCFDSFYITYNKINRNGNKDFNLFHSNEPSEDND